MARANNRVQRQLGLLVLLTLTATEARAVDFQLAGREFSLDLSWTTLFRYHDDNSNRELELTSHEDDFYLTFANSLNGRLATGPWSLGLRLDLVGFVDVEADRPAEDFRYDNLFRPGTTLPYDVSSAPFLPERLWGGYADGTFEATVGDFYATFGRGLALSVRKQEELGEDTAIRGARFQTSLGVVEFEALGGLINPANLEISELVFRDPDDAVAGTRLGVRPLDGLALGAHAVYAALHYAGGPLGDSPRQDTILAGGNVEALGLLDRHLDLYLEGVYQSRDPFDELGGDRRYGVGSGYGLYGSAVASLGPVVVTVELKDYNQLYFADEEILLTKDPSHETVDAETGAVTTLAVREAYTLYLHVPPNLERADQEASEQFNVLGGRLKVATHLPVLHTDVSASYVLYWVGEKRAELGGDRFPRGRRIYHALLGAEQHWDSGVHLLLAGGWREDYLSHPIGPDSLEAQLGHVEADLKVPVAPRHSLGLQFKHEEEFKAGRGRFREGDATLEYAWAPHLSLGATFDYTTHRFYVAEGHDWKPYFGGFVSVRTGPWATLRAFGGGRRGGQRCVGGQCRIFPPFVGFELAATIRY